MPVLQPADVDHRGQQQDGGQHHAVVAAQQRHRGQAVDDQQHNQRTDQSLHHRALAAPQADAAQHGSRQHRHFQADADVAAGRGQTRREEDAAQGRQHAAGDIAHGDRAPHFNAGVVGRAPRATNGRDMPARPQTGQENVAKDRDQDIDVDDGGHAEPVAIADEVPHFRVGQAPGNRGRVVGGEQVVKCAVDDQGDQGREEGAQAEVADQNAVDSTECRAAQQGGRDRRASRPLQHVHQIQGTEVGQRKHRTDR